MGGPLNEKQKRLLFLFKLAIENEERAQQMYAEMRDHSEGSSLKGVFEQLMLEEEDHEKSLRARYAQLRQTDEFKDTDEDLDAM
jgi:rubrerythrin